MLPDFQNRLLDNPIQERLVLSRACHYYIGAGGNATGLMNFEYGNSAKWLELAGFNHAANGHSLCS